jgi:N4-gp56 family major capsid protein
MAAALNRTGGLTQDMMTYYEKTFLRRAEYELILDQGAQKRTHGGNSGKSIVFSRYTPMSLATTALSEGANPATTTLITSSNVSCTLAEYGNTIKVSKFLSLTSIDARDKEKIELVGQNMGETLNRLVRNEIDDWTVMYANEKAKLSLVKTSDTLDAADIALMVRTLEINKAPRYDDGFYLAKTDPYNKYRIVQDSTWVAAKEYSDVKDLYKGEIGELYGVRFILNVDALSSQGDKASHPAYSTFVHGKDAFGTFDLAGDQPKLYITGGIDSSNQTGRSQMISWAGSYVVKTLNSDWCREFIAHGYTT